MEDTRVVAPRPVPPPAPTLVPVLLWVGVLALATGCGGAPSGGPGELAVDTLAGGVIQVTSSMEGQWGEAEGWVLEEELRIGTGGRVGPESFGQIAALAVDESGRIFVLDNQARELRIFGPAGEHLRTIGRQGGGPGEFGNPVGVAIHPAKGTIWVVDPGNGRYTVFGPDGEPAGTYPRPIGYFAWPFPGGFARDGEFFDVGPPRPRPPHSTDRAWGHCGGSRGRDPTGPDHPRRRGHDDEHGAPLRSPPPLAVRPPRLPLDRGERPPTLQPDSLVDHLTPLRRPVGLAGSRQQRAAGATDPHRPQAPPPHAGIPLGGGLDQGATGYQHRPEWPRPGRTDREGHERSPAKARLPDLPGGDRGHLWVEPSRAASDPCRHFLIFAPDGGYLGPVEVDRGLSASQVLPVFRGELLYALVADQLGGSMW